VSNVSMSEIAAKQRVLTLLKKVRNRQTLTAGELKELKAHEAMAASVTEPKEKPINPSVLSSQKEAATYCGVSSRTIRSWEREYALRDADGNYIIERLDERIAERDEDASPLKTRILTADAEHKEVRAELGRIQLKIRLGELVPREAIEVQRVERVLETRRVLMSLIRKLPPLLKGKTFAEMAETVRGEIYYVLGVFSGGPVPPMEPLAELKRIYDGLSPTQKQQARRLIGPRSVKKKTPHADR